MAEKLFTIVGAIACLLGAAGIIAFIALWALDQVLRLLKIKVEFLKYVWHRRTFRKWLKEVESYEKAQEWP